ncbi:hypothetical protein [Streptomyces phaeochromogenes]|uniref:hypothetical protein n=1 Tax=Streptomyces phaeochromogenes TaxID=1923 RepID=UPI003721E2A7
MGRKVRNMQTPEQAYQADRDAKWRAENAPALATRADLRAAYGSSSAELDRHVPLTARPPRVAADPEPKKQKKRRGLWS